MKTVQIKTSWLVYPPNYEPGDGYKKVNFLKKAWNIACSMGIGAEVHSFTEKVYKDGSRRMWWNDRIYVVGDK